MDIAKLAENKYRIKVKRGVAVVEVGKAVEVQGGATKTPFVINQPGEYEIEGISVFAYQAGATLSSVIQVEDLKVLTTAAVMTDALIEEQGTIDVVIVDTVTIPSKECVEMVGKIEPSCVVPTGDKDKVAEFVKDFEHSAREAAKLSLTRATLNSDITDVVILTD